MKLDQRIRILVADTFPPFAGQCAQFLDRAGYRVFQAHSLEEARGHLEQTRQKKVSRVPDKDQLFS